MIKFFHQEDIAFGGKFCEAFFDSLNSTAFGKAVEFFLCLRHSPLGFRRFFRPHLWKNLWKLWKTNVEKCQWLFIKQIMLTYSKEFFGNRLPVTAGDFPVRGQNIKITRLFYPQPGYFSVDTPKGGAFQLKLK